MSTNTMANNPFAARLDPLHLAQDFPYKGLCKDIWRDKYAQPGEESFSDTARRVVEGVYAKDPDEQAKILAYHAINAGLWVPAGRILAGAGTAKRVTLMNCYVTGTIDDSMEGIMREHTNFALTMQQGGGDGADFSPIRPEGAVLKRTGTKASGPLPFMDMWDAMCTTIRSAGDRRGAMMAVLSDTHPDLPKYIVAKQTPGRLTNFNISVLVSDAFMEAVKDDEDWVLHFPVIPWEREDWLKEYDFVDDNGVQQYAYSVWKARELWELITKNTYDWSEPGVIFIDRINEANNLWYCETIRCTNPCGEQPLPPHGSCNLGHVNLARMVTNPFTDNAQFDFNLLKEIVAIGTRFLDNVIDVTNYPLEEQRLEQYNKRRIGLGFTGLADAMAQLGIRYGSLKSADFAERVMNCIAVATYTASINLAKERGAFPLFDPDRYLDENSGSFVNRQMPAEIRALIRKYGIRNGVLNTIAPTGTTSIVFGNCSGGLEPVFAHFTQRNVRQADGSWLPYREYGYAARLFYALFGETTPLPSYMVTAEDLTVHEHILIQSRVQRWVDASISKTINIPENMPYDDFVKVYELAYNAGCKGCTTYRPSDVRGAVLVKASDTDATAESGSGSPVPKAVEQLRERPDVLHGYTYKVKWPRRDAAFYLTINEDDEGVPFEIFITSKDGSHSEWTTALSLMITAIFRKGGDVSFIPQELKQIQSLHDGAFIDQQYVGSLPAYIGRILEKHMERKKGNTTSQSELKIASADGGLAIADGKIVIKDQRGETCPSCKAPTLFRVEGCKKCKSCGYSAC